MGGERILNLGALKRTDKRSLGAVLTADTAGWFVLSLSLSLTFPRAGPDRTEALSPLLRAVRDLFEAGFLRAVSADNNYYEVSEVC